MEGRPIKVAIVGGGCAGITTAFELTHPALHGRYDVTVYQLGWRLGGKGASGRGPASRIEEHGLHLWMGFYENAFRVMRECYTELARDPHHCPIADWRDAFYPDPHNGIADLSPSGRWLPWSTHLPPFEGLPGDPVRGPVRWTVADYLARGIALVRTLLDAVRVRGDASEGSTRPPSPGTSGELMEAMRRWMGVGQLATLAALVEALGVMELALAPARAVPDNVFLRFHDAVAAAIRGQLESLVAGNDEVRRLWEIVDLVLAVVRGSVRHRLAFHPRGFEAIDEYDCRDWLRANGASERAVNSAFVRALYDLAFAYEGGDFARPRIAAGQALRGALRAFFTYRGSFFWKMRAGMGDIVFAPMYEVLRRRGVRFEFFHRLERVGLVDAAKVTPGERPWVDALEFDIQARVKTGTYEPLVDVHGLPCWPSECDWAQLQDGDRLRAEERKFESHWDTRAEGRSVLRVGEDFDLAVLAVGVGAVAGVTTELSKRDARWRTMVDNAHSVATQAFQLWLAPDMRQLGWTEAPINLSGFVEPFDTWADMSHLAPMEAWPAPPRSIAYFCSALPDLPDAKVSSADYPAQRREEVRQGAIRFLDHQIVHLWPHALRPGDGFRWETLVAPDGSVSPDATASRFATQFWTANVNPSDRYALSLPGTLKHRISPLDDTFDNFTIAGDWTDCGFNEGCVEAAVISGRLAAHAIAGTPRIEDIPGYDHP